MISHLRREYSLAGLSEEDLLPDPVQQFHRWFEEAVSAEVAEPNAMVLATVSDGGQPSTRVVLLKAFDARGFSFFTNYESRKGRELEGNPRAAVTFPWIELERQVCVTGTVSKLPRDEAELYFHSRPRGSQLGAVASRQSEILPDRARLEQRMAEMEQRYANQPVPMPGNWGGYVLSPEAIEFWQGRPSRLHDRLVYTRQADRGWKIHRLSP